MTEQHSCQRNVSFGLERDGQSRAQVFACGSCEPGWEYSEWIESEVELV
jgi:hypothetical protein